MVVGPKDMPRKKFAQVEFVAAISYLSGIMGFGQCR
jgi:hypothetical protein